MTNKQLQSINNRLPIAVMIVLALATIVFIVLYMSIMNFYINRLLPFKYSREAFIPILRIRSTVGLSACASLI